MTQVFYRATSQALPQFPLLQNRSCDVFRDDPRLPGTRWEPGGVTATFPFPFPDPGVTCTQVECLDPPLSRTPVVAHRLWPPQVWLALTNPWGAPRGEGPRTLTGAQGGPEASAWTEKEAGPALDGPAHR